MKKLHAIIHIMSFLVLANFATAKLCTKCNKLAYIQALGECPKCKGFTSSAAFKLCKKCSAKESKCQHCLTVFELAEGKKIKRKIHKSPSGKVFPTHWGAPPLRQTRDLRPLPGGYGKGSGTLARWIQQNLAEDKAGGGTNSKRPAVSRSFASKHPQGTYSEDELLVGMQKGMDKETCKNALVGTIPGLEIKRAMFGNTILHVTLPESTNVEQAIAKLKAVKGVRYSELNGRVGPVPQPIRIPSNPQPIQIQPAPPTVQLRPVPRPAPAPAPELVAEPPPPDPVAPPVFRIGGGGPVDKAKVALLEKSLATWKRVKKECGGNYSYKKRWSSWVGFGHETEIVVQNNKVVERRYKSFSGRPREIKPGQPPEKPKGTSWVETGKELGKNKKGHPPKTLDQLYVEAAGILARPTPPFQRLGLRFNKQGLLLACYTQDKRIADDAPTKGVSISTITLGIGSEKPVKIEGNKTVQPPLKLTKTSNGKTVKVQKGERIYISLEGNPTTGFTWNDATKSKVVKLDGNVTHRASSRLIGAPGASAAKFEAVSIGKGTIVLEYKRTWEKKTAAETFKVDVIVADKEFAAAGGKDSGKDGVKELELRIANMKNFARRARFTPEGHKKFLAELADLEKKLAILKGNRPGVPTYEEWIAGGKKIPRGLIFTGGSPWFNERTGQRRQPQEVYNMIYGKRAGPKPPLKLPRPIKPIARKPFPKHWGSPPRLQTKDLRPLPGGYGMGSSTLANWIRTNLEKDRKRDKLGD